MWRGELIHRNGEPLLRLAEERLQLAPAGFGADAHRHRHSLVKEGQARRAQLLIGAGLGGREGGSVFTAQQPFEVAATTPRPERHATISGELLVKRSLSYYEGNAERLLRGPCSTGAVPGTTAIITAGVAVWPAPQS